MANLEAQVVRLAYSSRGEFAAATSSVPNDKPISALIYGETPMVVGYKVNGVYRYVEDQKAAVTALGALVDANSNNIASLAATVSQLSPAGIYGASTMLGITSAFQNLPIPARHLEKYNPLTAIPCRLWWLTSGDPYVPGVRIHVGSGSGRGENYYAKVVLGDEYGVYIFENEADAIAGMDAIAYGATPLGSEFVQPIQWLSDGNKTWGWVECRNEYYTEQMVEVVCRIDPIDDSFKFAWSDDYSLVGSTITIEAQVYLDTTGWDGGHISAAPFLGHAGNFKQYLVEQEYEGSDYGFPITKNQLEQLVGGAFIGMLPVRIVTVLSSLVDDEYEFLSYLDIPYMCGYEGIPSYNRTRIESSSIMADDLYVGMDLWARNGEGGVLTATDVVSAKVSMTRRLARIG